MFKEFNRKRTILTKEDKEFLYNLEGRDLTHCLIKMCEDKIWDEEIMREFSNIVPFGEFAIWQDVSKDFIREFITKDCEMHVLVARFNRLPDKFLKEIKRRFENE